MPKTNHKRQYRDMRRYLGNPDSVSLTSREALDGTITVAGGGGWTWPYCCCGKRGYRRDRRGAKKFMHSRRRRKDRDYLSKTEIADM